MDLSVIIDFPNNNGKIIENTLLNGIGGRGTPNELEGKECFEIAIHRIEGPIHSLEVFEDNSVV
ncbi:MAG: hypothetical protein ACFE96_17240 [Candidatus Hermodarchaeota archaeon]